MPSTTVARLLERIVGIIEAAKGFLHMARDSTRCEEDFSMIYEVDGFSEE